MYKADEIKNIMEKSGTDKISLITNNYLITGKLYDCEVCNLDTFVNLIDVTICLASDISLEEKCDAYASTHFSWLHVNLDNVIAFSFIK